MTQKMVVHLFDDLDQTQLADGGQTVTFALQKTQYEIDLSRPNAAKLYEALAPFIAAGRRVGAPAKRTAVKSVDVAQTRAMRQWAKTHGMKVSDRGRISRVIQDAYHSVH